MNRLSMQPGSRVLHSGYAHVICQSLDMNTVLARNEMTGASIALKTFDCRPLRDSVDEQLNLDLIKDEPWLKALRDYELLGPLRDAPHATSSLVTSVMAASGWSRSTVLRRRNAFLAGGTISSLIPRSSPLRRKLRLSHEVEAIIEFHLDDYCDPNQPTKMATFLRVRTDCERASLPAPSYSTVSERIDRYTTYKSRMKRRSHRKDAQDRYDITSSEFAEARFPLSVVQFDHHLCDIMLVDEADGSVIGRPWLTLGIDVNSRMVFGFYLSFHEPGFGATGLAISHGILPKEPFVTDAGVNGSWPIRGIPAVIHVDNAKEFRGRSMERAIREWGIDLQFRPVKRPRYGGIVERLFLTLETAVHQLPGTTFSNPKQRGEYRSEQKATLTMRDFNRWLTDWIVNRYHKTPHRGLAGLTPLERYIDGRLGTPEKPGPGIPDEIMNPQKLRLDFLPSDLRKINNEGVRFDNLWFDSEMLHAMRASEPPDKHLEYLFKYDPRDMSEIYYYDESIKEYISIPRAIRSSEAVSRWEARAAKRRLQEMGVAKPDDRDILKAIERERDLIAETRKKTRRQQRRAQAAESARQKMSEMKAAIVQAESELTDMFALDFK